MLANKNMGNTLTKKDNPESSATSINLKAEQGKSNNNLLIITRQRN
jgi:hypothetical protein